MFKRWTLKFSSKSRAINTSTVTTPVVTQQPVKQQPVKQQPVKQQPVKQQPGNVRCQSTQPNLLATLPLSTLDNIGKFTLKGLSTWGKVVKIYDGDSIHVLHDIPGDHIATFCPLPGLSGHKQVTVVRMAGIDAVELKTPHGIEARDILAAKIARSNWIWIQFQQRDKYGRELAYIWNENSYSKSINEEVIGLKAADGTVLFKEYYGGKR